MEFYWIYFCTHSEYTIHAEYDWLSIKTNQDLVLDYLKVHTHSYVVISRVTLHKHFNLFVHTDRPVSIGRHVDEACVR